MPRVPTTNQRSRILIVEDDFSTSALLRHILEKEHFVTCVENGREALDSLAHAEFDLILTDINMPVMTGFDLLEAVRSTPEYAHLPVVMLSALADSNAVARGLKMGANDYLTKPLDRQITLARVNTQLQLKALMDAHKHAIEELRAAQQMRDRFFSIASHDLKNPMNNIRMAQFLLRGIIENDPNAAILLDNIDIALETMQEIVRDFLDTAALQGQALGLELDCVKVEDVLWDVVMQFNITAHKKNIVLDVSDSEGYVLADYRRLLQAISNLVSNAIKYSPYDAVVKLSAVISEEWVRINIIDQGQGIPANERDRLFTEFGKLSTRPTAGENSTGLGLWIVKQLVALQEGRVGVECPPEGGSIFWIELPAWSADCVARLVPEGDNRYASTA
jgi:signal transduction histidine kinase